MMKVRRSRFFICLAWLLSSVSALTTTFGEILVAHASPSFCPSADSWQPDSNYIVCCNEFVITSTVTTALGPGSTPAYACCPSGDKCTGAMKIMSDWSYDNDGSLTSLALRNVPKPTAAPAITTPPGASIGTVSGPGATPYTTADGVVVYISNDNSNTNINGDGNANVKGDHNNVGTNGGMPLSHAEIGGISAAAAILSAVAAWLGLWYERRRRAKRRDGSQHDSHDLALQEKEGGKAKTDHGSQLHTQDSIKSSHVGHQSYPRQELPTQQF